MKIRGQDSSSLLEELNKKALREVFLEELREDFVAKRIRYVCSPSSGHEVLIVDNSMMLQIKKGVVLPHRKSNGCLPPDILAQEVLMDTPWADRSPDLLLERAIKNALAYKKNCV